MPRSQGPALGHCSAAGAGDAALSPPNPARQGSQAPPLCRDCRAGQPERSAFRGEDSCARARLKGACPERRRRGLGAPHHPHRTHLAARAPPYAFHHPDTSLLLPDVRAGCSSWRQGRGEPNRAVCCCNRSGRRGAKQHLRSPLPLQGREGSEEAPAPALPLRELASIWQR